MRIEAKTKDGSAETAIEIGLFRSESGFNLHILAELNNRLCFNMILDKYDAEVLCKSIQNDLNILKEEPKNDYEE